MRLLSIFALLFLISILLHGRMEPPSVPEDSAQDEEQPVVVQEVVASPEQEDFSTLIFDKPYPTGHFKFEAESAFSRIELELKNLILGKNNDGFKATNHFCAVGYEYARTQQGRRRSAAKREVLVYWREGGAIYRWNGGDPNVASRDFYSVSSLLYSARSIPLDLAPSGSESEESAVSENRERTRGVITDCEKHGKSYVIDPFAPPPRGFRQPERTPATPVTPPVTPVA